MGSISSAGTPLPSSAEMSAVDARTRQEYSIPELVLMENAGQRIWARVLAWAGPRLSNDARLVIVAGTGNNGGDALVIARAAWLEGRFALAVVLTRRPDRGPAAVHAAACEALGVPITVYDEDPEDAHALIGEADWVVDGLLGTGLSGAVRGSTAALIEELNTCDAVIVAIDVPSGVGDTFKRGFTAVRADITLTVELPKQALYLPYARPFCGEIETVSIGFPPQLLHSCESGVRLLGDVDRIQLLPVSAAEAYKNTRGSLAVFGGAAGTAGALLLSAAAAARGRCGYVTAFVDPEVYRALGSRYPSLVVRLLGAGSGAGDAAAEDTGAAARTEAAGAVRRGGPYHAVLCGPGWGLATDRDGLLEAVMAGELPGVLDADGLRVLARLRAAGRVTTVSGRWVLTPHPGEFTLLAGGTSADALERPVEAVRRVAGELNAVVVLKAHVCYIADPESAAVYVVDGMNPGLGTAGSGDVLAGVIAGLLAHGCGPLHAACLGVLIHQRAGAMATRERSWYAAEELLEYLGPASEPRNGSSRDGSYG